MIKKKFFLYTGNHNSTVGIIDYLKTLYDLSKHFGFILHIKNNLEPSKYKNYQSVIFIEQFHTLEHIYNTNLVLDLFKGKKILILTEFFNKSRKTLNNFENITIKNSDFLIEIYFKFVNLLIITKTLGFVIKLTRFLLNIYSIIKVYSLKIFFFLIQIFIKFIALIIILLLFQRPINIFIWVRLINIQLTKFKIKSKLRATKKFKNHLKNNYNLSLDEYHEYILMKKRYFSLMLLINRFDIILKSHDQIKLKDFKMHKLYFSLSKKVPEIIFDKRRKIILEFSGILTKYRIKALVNFLQQKNDFFDYSKIEDLLLNARFYENKFIKSQTNLKNVCSIHLRKTDKWPYSSPTRYINSINKNQIPLTLDNFNDLESKLLTVKKNVLNCVDYEEFYSFVKEINSGILEYQKMKIVESEKKKIFF